MMMMSTTTATNDDDDGNADDADADADDDGGGDDDVDDDDDGKADDADGDDGQEGMMVMMWTMNQCRYMRKHAMGRRAVMRLNMSSSRQSSPLERGFDEVNGPPHAT